MTHIPVPFRKIFIPLLPTSQRSQPYGWSEMCQQSYLSIKHRGMPQRWKAAVGCLFLLGVISGTPLDAAIKPGVLTASVSSGQIGVPYSLTLTASGTAPITWGVISGALPTGMTLSASTGLLSGRPTASGVFLFTVRASNTAGTSSRSLSVTINAPPSVTTTSLSVALKNVGYSQALTATGTAPITWSLSSGSLPAGLTLASYTGLISGTPTASGVFGFTLRASNASGSASRALSLTVNVSASISTKSLPDAVMGAAYSQTLTATGTDPITWGIISGALPGGLSLNSATGVISGNPTDSGQFSLIVKAANSWSSESRTFSLKVRSLAEVPIGINMSEAEYSWGSFPSQRDLSFITSYNIRLVRLPIAWERAQPQLFGPLDSAYISAMKDFISMAGAQGTKVIVDVHNYGRYNSSWAQDAAANYGYVAVGKGDPIGSAAVPYSAFADLWSKLSGALRGTLGLGSYDIMNEPYDMGSATVWPTAAQNAVNAIRTVDTVTPILVEGTQWASAYWWPYDNGNLRITDPANNLLYEAHLYFDGDGSGTYTQSYTQQGAYPGIGADRVQPFLNWLRQNNARGFLGEFGIPNDDPRWLPVLDNFLIALQSAGVSGTYWNYAFHSPADPDWWPTADNKSIIIGQANPAINILSSHNVR